MIGAKIGSGKLVRFCFELVWEGDGETKPETRGGRFAFAAAALPEPSSGEACRGLDVGGELPTLVERPALAMGEERRGP